MNQPVLILEGQLAGSRVSVTKTDRCLFGQHLCKTMVCNVFVGTKTTMRHGATLTGLALAIAWTIGVSTTA